MPYKVKLVVTETRGTERRAPCTYYKPGDKITFEGNHIIKEAEILPSAIDSIIVWSEVLREARNAIHFGAKPTIPNSYEKVSVLLIDGAKNFSVMYKIKSIADNIVDQDEEKGEKT